MEFPAKQKLSAFRLTKKRASALVTVCIFSAIILMIAGGSIASITYQTRSTGRSLAYKQSLALAEAGAEVALATLNTEGNTWSGWTSQGSDRVLSDIELEDVDGNVVGTYSVTVMDADTNTPLISAVGSAQIGSSGPVSREVRIPVKGDTTPSAFGPYGIYSTSDILVNSRASTDGYDSEVGPRGTGNMGLSHAMAAAGNITLNANASVGDLQAGGWINAPKNSDHGEIEDYNMPTAPPPYPDDALAAAKANNDNHKIQISEYKKNQGETIRKVGIPADGKFNYGNLNVNGTMRIRFPEGTYYLHNLQINSNADILVDGPVKIYMDPGQGQQAILMSSNTTFNSEGENPNPADLQMFIKSGNITFNSNYTMYAGLFAPNTDLAIFNSNTYFYGAVVAGKITMNSNSHIYVDKNMSAPASAAGFLAEAWTEVSATY